MNITNELREYANTRISPNRGMLTVIADRIDAEHEKAIRELNNLADASVLLPVDADGEYIHMGDRMENGELVVRIVLTDGSWEPTVYTASTPNQLHEHYCHNIRHYHAPTVEDVLREFAVEVCGEPALTIRSGVVEEYASRLRLAGES
jgi:hypothetical protein